MLATLAYDAILYNYTRPTFSEDRMEIIGGRHPVVERFTRDFVENDLYMDDEKRFTVITGPNMSGKSTFIRQVGLISLMAQIGSFVPAKKAVLPVFDRIFTRMGARDDLAGGRSTFLVEMNEMALILLKATKRVWFYWTKWEGELAHRMASASHGRFPKNSSPEDARFSLPHTSSS